MDKDDLHRLGEQVSALQNKLRQLERTQAAAEEAVRSLNEQLADLGKQAKAEGVSSLDDLDSEIINLTEDLQNALRDNQDESNEPPSPPAIGGEQA